MTMRGGPEKLLDTGLDDANRRLFTDEGEQTSDEQRYPTLSAAGNRMLQFLSEHPHAPLYRNQSGNRLTESDVARVRAFEHEVAKARLDWTPGTPPGWIPAWISECLAEVPRYRRWGLPAGTPLESLPTSSRADLAQDVASFVPDGVPVQRLINFRTSGTTGHPLLLASHPVVAASYLAFHKRALRLFDVELRAGQGEVGVVLLGFQKRCFTYVSVTPTMNESGLAKINLHLDDWRDPDDRWRYLEALAPEVVAGDPLSFGELLTIPLRIRPRAILSTAMALTSGLRRLLEERFECPVLDLYSMNEAGPIAVAHPRWNGHVLLQHRCYVEILDSSGEPVPAGQRGEITLTGGFNFCLPLLRYRTGDHAQLHRDDDGTLVLLDLEGRPPVRFRNVRGEWLNNIEVTHAFRPFPLTQYTLHQVKDGRLELSVCGPVSVGPIRKAVQALFGVEQPLTITQVDNFPAKVVQYRSELSDTTPAGVAAVVSQQGGREGPI